MRDLFEDLKEKVGCDYISDLRYGTNLSYAAAKANRFRAADYDLYQWNDLAEYLFSDKKNLLLLKRYLLILPVEISTDSKSDWFDQEENNRRRERNSCGRQYNRQKTSLFLVLLR